jgi:hypothetical protein
MIVNLIYCRPERWITICDLELPLSVSMPEELAIAAGNPDKWARVELAGRSSGWIGPPTRSDMIFRSDGARQDMGIWWAIGRQLADSA